MQFFCVWDDLEPSQPKARNGKDEYLQDFERWSWLWNCDIDEEHLGYPGVCGIRQFFGMKDRGFTMIFS